MDVDVHVTRHSFFREGGHTLRFTESAPATHAEHGPVCGCTTDVAERPVGEPEQVQTSVRLVTGFEGRTYEVEVGSGIRGFWVRWPWPKDLPQEPYQRDTEGHAYFWPRPGNGIQVELVGVPVEGCCNLSHTVLTRLYFDDQVDVSRMFNGHSPSRIVEPENMKGKVWVHNSAGKEALAVLSSGPSDSLGTSHDYGEALSWRRFAADLDVILDRPSEPEGTPAEVHEGTTKDLREEALSRAVWWIHCVLSDPDTTALVRASRDVHQQLIGRFR